MIYNYTQDFLKQTIAYQSKLTNFTLKIHTDDTIFIYLSKNGNSSAEEKTVNSLGDLLMKLF